MVKSIVWNITTGTEQSVMTETTDRSCVMVSLHIVSQDGIWTFQVRGELQTLSVRGDKMWQEIRDLQRGLDDLKTEQGAMQHRTYQILLKIKRLAELSLEGGVQHNIVGAMKVKMPWEQHSKTWSQTFKLIFIFVEMYVKCIYNNSGLFLFRVFWGFFTSRATCTHAKNLNPNMFWFLLLFKKMHSIFHDNATTKTPWMLICECFQFF